MGVNAACRRVFGRGPNPPKQLYAREREGGFLAVEPSAFSRFCVASHTLAEVLRLVIDFNLLRESCACCNALPDRPRPLT